MDTHEPLWTTRQAAAYLNVHEGTLHKWRQRGHGPPAIQLGDSEQTAVRYDPCEVRAWVAERTVGKVPA